MSANSNSNMPFCTRLLLVLACVVGLFSSTTSALYKNATFGFKTTTNITYARGLVCEDAKKLSTCTPFDLKLDVYEPVALKIPVPSENPAYILSHGGGNSGGSKEQFCFQGSAQFMAQRGFVAFNIDYRLAGQHGLLPNMSQIWPPAPPGPGQLPIVAVGAKLVTAIGRSNDYFNPHPEKPHDDEEDEGEDMGNERTNEPKSYTGVIQLPTSNGTLCMTSLASSAAVSSTVTLELCGDGDSSQQWKIADISTLDLAPITHFSSGLCLNVPSMETPTAGFPIELGPCAAASLWEIGFSGALLTFPVPHTMLSAAAQGSHLRNTNEQQHNNNEQQHNNNEQQQTSQTLLQWTPSWASGYPAVRDLKAAIRFVRANAVKYNIDSTRVVVSGGSAGATNSLASGIVFEDDYKSELTVAEDPTLATTNLDFNSSVQCVVAHWSSDGEVLLPQEYDVKNRSRYSKNSAPVIEFHGSADPTINISHAYAVLAAYKTTGVPYELHVLEGCGHGAWCYNGKGNCSCAGSATGTYTPLMDTIALSFVATQLGLPLE